MHVLNAKGKGSRMELTLCKDGKWRPSGFVENAKLFFTVEEAEQYGYHIHDEGRMQHWTFTVTEELVYAK
jgi:hypothetical protein